MKCLLWVLYRTLIFVMTSKHGNTFGIVGPLWGNSPDTDGFASPRASNVKLFFSQPEKAVEQTVKWCVIWDAMMLMWQYACVFHILTRLLRNYGLELVSSITSGGGEWQVVLQYIWALRSLRRQTTMLVICSQCLWKCCICFISVYFLFFLFNTSLTTI